MGQFVSLLIALSGVLAHPRQDRAQVLGDLSIVADFALSGPVSVDVALHSGLLPVDEGLVWLPVTRIGARVSLGSGATRPYLGAAGLMAIHRDAPGAGVSF